MFSISKIQRGDPCFFQSEVKKPKMKRNYPIFDGGCSRQQIRKKSNLLVFRGAVPRGGGAVPVEFYGICQTHISVFILKDFSYLIVK